ncbi:MAG: hypothetical protein FJ161_01760 [Gammaproteobacteria bacterium]|nr:hypothetical protein [Gammaproteobacteria bacterium]
MSVNLSDQINRLHDSLHYLYVSELKQCCDKIALSFKGKKIELINRIIHFLKTGEKIELKEYPVISIAKKRQDYELACNALMLKGSYKNDLKNRIFFKEIIGQHFHFTAFGIDWLETRWMDGNPPTYQEFADMWSKEYEFRKIYGSAPKAEWAYINFVKRYLNENPNASRNEILISWELERTKHKELVDNFCKNYL